MIWMNHQGIILCRKKPIPKVTYNMNLIIESIQNDNILEGKLD